MIGIISNDNRGGSITRTLSKNLTKTFHQVESWSNTAGVGIKVGASFKTGVPFIAEGKISSSVSSSFSHNWG